MNNNRPIQNKEGLIQFRKEVTISSQQTRNLLSDPKGLAQKFEAINSKAHLYMEEQKWQHALVILEQAERLLQAATTKGMPVERYLIQCVFHNEACCYQNLWQLEQCSNYIEALIYNFNTKTNDSSQLQSSKNDYLSKYGLAKYYLQFCAVNSQLGNHSGALIAARKALDIIKKELVATSKNVEKQNNPKNKAQHQEKMKLLNIICHFNDSVNLQNLQLLQQCTAYFVQLYRQNVTQRPIFGKDIKRKIQNFTIKSVMQIQCLSYENFIITLKNQNSTTLAKIYDMLFVLATSYFTMATELRILSLAKLKQANAEQKQNHPQFKQSFIYHLYSCLIMSLTLNVHSPFLQHLLSTYHSHFNTDLLAMNVPYKKLYNEFIFSTQNKQVKQISIICSDQDEGMGSLISKGSGTLVRFTKSSKQSEKQYKFSLIDSKKLKRGSKKKIKTKVKAEEGSKGKKTGSSLSKSPSSKTSIPKGSLITKSQKSKESIGFRSAIPSIKQIFVPAKSKIDEQAKKNRQRQKTNSKSKKKGKLQDRINEYFLNKGAQNKTKKSSVSTKKSSSQVKLTGRLPINSTLQAKEPTQIAQVVGKEKKKSSKKSFLQHYL